MSLIKSHKPSASNHHSNANQSFVQQTVLQRGQNDNQKDNQTEQESAKDVQLKRSPFGASPLKGEPFVRQTVFGQAKLNIGKANDKYEVEADRVADKVVSKNNAPAPPVQKKDAGGPKESEGAKEEDVQMKSAPEQETEIQEKPISDSITTGIQLKPIAPTKDAEVQKKEEDTQGGTEVQAKLDASTDTPEKIQKVAATAEDNESTIQRMPEKREPVDMTERKPETKGEVAEKKGEETSGFEQLMESATTVGNTVQAKNEDESEIQTKTENSSEDSNIEHSLNSSKGKGSPLDGDTKSTMESGFGADFSGVRIHTDSKSSEMNKGLGAKAFTNGNDIYFNEGQYNPSNKEGQHLLAHELTHTVQQGASSGKVQKKEEAEPINIDPLEARNHIQGEKQQKRVGQANRNVKQEYKTPESEPRNEEIAEKGKENLQQVEEKKEDKSEKKKGKKDKKDADGKKKGKNKKKAPKKAKQPLSEGQLKKQATEAVYSAELEAPHIVDLLQTESASSEEKTEEVQKVPEIQLQHHDVAPETTDPELLKEAQQKAVGSIKDQNQTSKSELKQSWKQWDGHFAKRAAQINTANDQKFNLKIADTRKQFKQEQINLDASIFQSRITINIQFVQQVMATIQKGMEQKTAVNERFDQHKENIDLAVVDALYMASDHHDESMNLLYEAIASRAEKARSKGKIKAATYPNTERGKEQKKAVTPVAEEAANEIEGSYGDTAEIIKDAYIPVGDQFIEIGEQFKQGTDESKAEVQQGVIDLVTNAVKQLLTQVKEANKNLTAQHKMLSKNLQKLETDSIKSLTDAKQNARKQVNFATAGARASLLAYYQRSEEQLDALRDESLQIISVPDKLDQEKVKTYAEEIVQALKVQTAGFIEGMKLDSETSDAEIDKTNNNIQQNKTILSKSIETNITDFNAKKVTALAEFETKVAEMLRKTYDSLVTGLDNLFLKVDEQLNQIIADMNKEFKKILKDIRKEVVANIAEAMQPHDEVLSELNGQMNEAAADAAWAYDHPILSALGDFFAFLGMLILGILLALALIFVLLYAMAALVAFLVYLGASVLVAQIIVYGAAIGYLIYNATQSYNQRVAEGQETGVWTWTKGLFDATGVTAFSRAFTQENLTWAERGWKIGFNGTMIVSIFRGGRINKTVQKYLPTKFTNPTRGGFWKLFKSNKPKVTKPSHQGMAIEEFIGEGMRMTEQPFNKGGKKTNTEITGKVDFPHETAQAIELGNKLGGGKVEFGNNQMGIEGYFIKSGGNVKTPFSLKKLTTDSPKSVFREIRQNGKKIQKLGASGDSQINFGSNANTVIFVETVNLSKTEILAYISANKANIFPENGIFHKIFIKTKNGELLEF